MNKNTVKIIPQCFHPIFLLFFHVNLLPLQGLRRYHKKDVAIFSLFPRCPHARCTDAYLSGRNDNRVTLIVGENKANH